LIVVDGSNELAIQQIKVNDPNNACGNNGVLSFVSSMQMLE